MPFQTAKKPQDQPFHLQRIGRRDILKVEVWWIGCINPIKPQRMCRIYTFKFQKIKNAKRLKDRLHQTSKSLLDNQYNFQTLEKWLLAIWIWTMDPFRVWRSSRSSNIDGLWVKISGICTFFWAFSKCRGLVFRNNLFNLLIINNLTEWPNQILGNL